jgi:signal transduction histidine kinase
MSNAVKDQKQDLFQIIAEDAIMAIAVFDSGSKKCIYLNKMAREILELPIGKDQSSLSFADLLPNENFDNKPDWRPLTEAIVESEGLQQDLIIKKVTDRLFIADVGVHQFSINALKMTALMFRDITFQKKLQRDITAKQVEIQAAFKELQEQNTALKALDRAKDKFIALTTHELRTPLSAMIATAEVLHLKLYDGDEQRDMFIHTIHEEGQHLLEIVNDILDFSKIQAGKMDFFVEQLSPNEVVERMVENFKQMGEAKGVSLLLKQDPNAVPCFFDPLRFKQVFTNVLSNAVKFTNPNTSVEVGVEDCGAMVKVTIRDHGPGISPENASKVFDEFETVGNVATHHKGTGLGMPISKKLIERMGGAISFTSTLGEGTTFVLELPKSKTLNEEDYRQRPDYNDDLAA